MSNSVWPHRWQPTRLRRSWGSPGKNTGVGCHFLLQPCRQMLYRLSHQGSPWQKKQLKVSKEFQNGLKQIQRKKKLIPGLWNHFSSLLLSGCVGALKASFDRKSSILQYHKYNKAFHPTHCKSITPSLPESIPICHFPFDIHSVLLWAGEVLFQSSMGFLFFSSDFWHFGKKILIMMALQNLSIQVWFFSLGFLPLFLSNTLNSVLNLFHMWSDEEKAVQN